MPWNDDSGPSELVALVEVGRGAAHGLLGHAQLDGAQPGPGPLEHPRHHLGAVAGHRPGRRRLPTADPVEMEMGVDLAVGGRGPLAAWRRGRRDRRGPR